MKISTNEILYHIQKSLNFTTKEILDIYTLESYPMELSHLNALLTRKQDKTFKFCSYEELGVFLDGLITFKRGSSPHKESNNKAVELTNNLILKKLRIAMELKESEIEIIFGLADIELSKQKLASLFRKEGHKNFKPCSDELLMAFLEGLDEFYYVGKMED